MLDSFPSSAVTMRFFVKLIDESDRDDYLGGVAAAY
jgi:hypothetical protein